MLSVEIRIGAREFVPVSLQHPLTLANPLNNANFGLQIPVTFHGYVYMDYNDDCRIYSARAYADIPTSVLGQLVAIGAPGGGLGPVCQQLPIGGQKRDATLFSA